MSETLLKELKRQAALQRLNGWDDLARQTEKKIAKLKGKSPEEDSTIGLSVGIVREVEAERFER